MANMWYIYYPWLCLSLRQISQINHDAHSQWIRVPHEGPSRPSSPRSPYQSFSVDPRKETWFLFSPWTNMTRTATYSELFCDKWYSIMRNLEDTEILQGRRTWMSWPTKWNLSSMLEERCDWNWHKRRRVSPWQAHGWRHWSDREDPTSAKDREQLRTSLLMYNYLTKDWGVQPWWLPKGKTADCLARIAKHYSPRRHRRKG